MALQTADDYAQALVDAMDAADPDGFGAQDADVHAKVRDVLGTAIATVILAALADARVAFGAGSISGSDSHGDSHTGLTATGGTLA